MKLTKVIWSAYIKMIYLIFVSGHTDKDGCIHSYSSARMNYQLTYFMVFGAILPSMPFVLAVKEVSLLFGFQYWFLLGIGVFFAFSIAVGMSIKKLVDAAPKSSMLTPC